MGLHRTTLQQLRIDHVASAEIGHQSLKPIRRRDVTH